MSGLEVASVVLGAVPIIVSALENYKSSKNLWRRMRKTAMHIEELIEEIMENRALIEANVESLLHKIGAEEAVLGYNMIEKLRKHDIAPDIKSFMGKLYEPYEKALRRCERVLQKIVDKFGGLVLDSNKKGPLKTLDDVADAQSRSNGRYTFVNRIKFSVKKDELDELIADLKQSRRSLEEIARARVDKDVALPNHSPNAIRLAGFFDQVQHHAIGLYSGIHAAWGDKCHSNHAARLLLNSWSEAISTRRKPRIAFGVAFESSSGPTGMETCKGFSIGILTEEDVDEQRPDQACVVRFQNLDRETKPTYTVVDSICASFLQTPQTKPPHDGYLSPDQKLRYQSTRETRQLNTPTPIVPHVHLSESDFKTLDEILTQNIRINPWDGIKIAFVLVSAQLQLHSTPWLPTFWSKDILRFPYIKDPHTSEISVIYSCAFLQRDFSATTKADE
ncbi:MAG: hypothetical protein Q9172_005922 [Xanthocarpia lactea]